MWVVVLFVFGALFGVVLLAARYGFFVFLTLTILTSLCMFGQSDGRTADAEDIMGLLGMIFLTVFFLILRIATNSMF